MDGKMAGEDKEFKKIEDILYRWFSGQDIRDIRFKTNGYLHSYRDEKQYSYRLAVFNDRNEPLLIAPISGKKMLSNNCRKEYPDLRWLLNITGEKLTLSDQKTGKSIRLDSDSRRTERKTPFLLLLILLAATGAGILIGQLL